MNVLILCEYSAIVRDEFRNRGHNAWSCDLLQSEKGGNHLQMDCLTLLQQRITNWDLIGMHLPCTAIALSGNLDYGEGGNKHEERIKSISWTKNCWDTAISLCKHVYFENPMNVMPKYIGKATQIINPWEFGHPEKKQTWLWLHGLPKLQPTNDVWCDMMELPKKERERNHYMTNTKRRGLERSRTYLGIAKAMAEQWG